MKITQVRLWKNTGYTEGTLVVPSATSTLGSADSTYSTDYRPPASELFKRIKLKKDLLAALEWTYLEVTMESDAGNTSVFYGWVDSIECLTDSETNPLLAVNWHVDLWRTYLSKASFGYGVVTRRSWATEYPPQSMNPRYWVPSDTLDVMTYDESPRLHWVFITYAGTVASSGESGTFKGVSTVCFPVVANSTYKVYNALDYPFPSWSDVVVGRADERLKIDPESIIGAFISPIAPYTVVRSTSGTHLQVSMAGWADGATSLSTEDGYGYFVSQGPSSYGNFVKTLNASTYDTQTAVVTDFDGAPVASLPWGIRAAYCSYRIVDCVTTMYVGLRFRNTSISAIQSPSMGMEVNIPLKTLPISSNAYSSYVYSGQAEYDRETLAINRRASLDSGLGNTANAAVQGAVAGGVMGSAVPGVGTLLGAGIGAVTGAVGNLATTGIDYLVSGKKNDAMLEATLTATANQTSGLLLPSVGMDWVRNGRDIKLVMMVWDDYSKEQYENEFGLAGVRVHEPVATLDSTIKAMTAGPLQVKNLVVRGPIPNTAREYIAKRFSDGVIFA